MSPIRTTYGFDMERKTKFAVLEFELTNARKLKKIVRQGVNRILIEISLE